MIPKRPYSRWDGGTNYQTKDCESCPFYRKISRDDLCGWGIAFKYLAKTEDPKKCEIRNRNRPAPREQSIKYLDELIGKRRKSNALG